MRQKAQAAKKRVMPCTSGLDAQVVCYTTSKRQIQTTMHAHKRMLWEQVQKQSILSHKKLLLQSHRASLQLLPHMCNFSVRLNRQSQCGRSLAACSLCFSKAQNCQAVVGGCKDMRAFLLDCAAQLVVGHSLQYLRLARNKMFYIL